MKIYANRGSLNTTADILNKFQGTDNYVMFDIKWVSYLQIYIKVISFDGDTVIFCGLDTATLAALGPGGAINMDTYRVVQRNIAGTAPTRISLKKFCSKYKKHTPLEVLSVEELQELLDATEVYNEDL